MLILAIDSDGRISEAAVVAHSDAEETRLLDLWKRARPRLRAALKPAPAASAG